jgi:hypothetical protein
MIKGAVNDEKDVIENIGVLNLKDSTKEEIEKMRKIKNVGVIIVPKRFIGTLHKKIVENVGVVIPYEEGAISYTGKTVLNADALRIIEKPIDIIQGGILEFTTDVTKDLILQKINSIKNYGKIVAPPEIYGALMTKCVENMGMIVKIGNKSEKYRKTEERGVAITWYLGIIVGGVLLVLGLCWFLHTQNIYIFNIDIWTVCSLSLVILGVVILVGVLWLRSLIRSELK